MINIVLAFVTGLTTGGLSCLAVQGGLLASSLAGQIESGLQNVGSKSVRRQPVGKNTGLRQSKLARPILAFLAAKLLAYTLLGFLLGLVGQMFQLSPFARALLQISIGIFMLGMGLRMLNVHPIFRYFAFEPPAFLRRRLRKTAAEASSIKTPILLGLLTVLIPCGVTQAMMAVALSAASPMEGAALMFAFTLGTSPVFFAVAYLATRLGAKLEKHFIRFVAAVLIVLAVVTIDGGITLAGSPVSLSRLAVRVFASTGRANAVSPVEAQQVYGPSPTEVELPVQSSPDTAAAEDENVVTVNVKNYGYEPDVVRAKAGAAVKLRLVSSNVQSCSRAFVIPSLGVQELLESTGETVIEIPPQDKGTQIPFSCSMGMFGGTILFD